MKMNTLRKLLFFLVMGLVFSACDGPATSETTSETTKADQSLNLEKGWNCVSFFVQPENVDSIQDVIMPISKELKLMLSGYGAKSGLYNPAENKSSIGPFTTNKAYLIKLNEAATLDVLGDSVFMDSIFMDAPKMENTAHFAAYYPIPTDLHVLPVDLIFGNTDNLILIHDYNGGTYWPKYDINDIGLLKPGKSYLFLYRKQASMTVHDIISDMDDFLPAKKIIPAVNLPEDWMLMNTSPFLSLILIPNNLIPEAQNGDYLGAFREDGLCAGVDAVRISEKYSMLVVYANDGITDEVDGMRKNDPIVLKYFHAKDQSVDTYHVELDNTPDGLFSMWNANEVTKLIPIK